MSHAQDRSKQGTKRPAEPPAKSDSVETNPTPGHADSLDARGLSALRYRVLFEHSLAGAYCTTFDGVILDCNESLASMLGYSSREEVMQLRAPDLYFGDSDRNSFIEELRRTGVLTNSEICLRKKDGSPIHILENVILLPDENGQRRIIQGTMIDITERKLAEEALRESEQRYRALADELRHAMQRVESVREEERARIARELHDELGQVLTVLNMDLHWLKGRVAIEDGAIRGRIDSMCELVNNTIRSVREICVDLRPAVLDDLGLIPAIEWLAREFESRMGIRCEARLPSSTRQIRGEQATALFRILQESLTNIVRHARAQTVRVTLDVELDELTLTVADDGIGISPERSHGSHSVGLVGMRERALRWGGNVSVTGAPMAGTTVVVRMPLNAKKTESD